MSIEYKTDFSDVAGIIGSVNGAAKVLDDDRYMDQLLTKAHNKATVQFDRDATAFAMASGALAHMFEWGTVGINPGRTTRRFNPDSDQAKLWRHTLKGFGNTKTASFEFDPSVVPVPKPTVQRTGVPTSELNKLTGGPYIFAGKAAIMEAGIEVTIRPRNTWLFVPFGNDGATNGSAAQSGRNFIFTKGPIYTVPGRKYAGTFTQFWMGWWASEGTSTLTEYVHGHVSDRMSTLVDSIGRRMGKRPQRMTTRQFQLQVEKAETQAKAFMYGGLTDDNRY